MTKDELIELIESYFGRITQANDCLQLYKTIVNAKRIRLKEMNYAPAFFGVVERSIINDMLITTAKLFDNARDTMSIEKLLNICSQNKQCFLQEHRIGYLSECDEEKELYVETSKIDIEEDIKKARAELEELQSIIANLKTRRDKYYAHNDRKYLLTPNKLQLDAPLCFDDVESLLMFSEKVCNKMLCNINQQVFVTQSSNIDDIMNILNRLHEYEI